MDKFSTFEIFTLIIVGINFIWGLAIVPWLSRVTKLEARVEKLSDAVQTQYMSKQDFENHMTRIETALSEIKGYVMNNRRRSDD